jgi:integrase
MPAAPSTTITVKGIDGTIYRVKASPRYRIYFLDPIKRERVRVSLGTADLKMARAKARAILTKVADEGLKVVKKFHRRETAPRIGKVVDHYEEVTSCKSAKVNKNCLLRVVRTALKLPSKDAARDQSLAVLNAKLVSAYLRNAKVADYSKRSCLASARSVFSRPQDWEDLPLPDLSEFLKASSRTGVKSPRNSFRQIDKATLQSMEEASQKHDPAVRRAFILCRYLGLTPKEVSFARKSWIEERQGKHVLCVRERPDEDFTLKTGGQRERDIGLLPWMATELLGADDYIIPLPTPFLRHNFMLRTFNFWVRQFLPNRKGAAYDLRKQAGSDWLEHFGKISMVQHLLGHSSPVTTGKWYATWEKQVDTPEIFVPAVV